VVLVVSLLPLMTLFNQEGERPWHLWLPALAQATLMGRVLKGEPMGWGDVLLPALACGALTLLCLVYIARQFSRAAIK
jgi:sodium transport system permease protein